MAKQMNSSRSGSKKLPWVARHQILTLLILVAAGCAIYAGAYTIQQHHQIAAERKQFMQAKTDLDELYGKIVAAAGEPVQHKALQYCSYTSVELGQGVRSCDIGHVVVFSPANQAIDVAVNAMRSMDFHDVSKGNKGGNDSTHYNEVHVISFTDKSGLSCLMDVWKFSDGTLPPGFQITSGRLSAGILVDLECGGGAKAEYFPVISD